LQYHSLAAIVRSGQWNALRHGHFAYYSTTALRRMLGDVGLSARTAWEFDLYGGTVLLAATRDGGPDARVTALSERDAAAGMADPAVVGGLARQVDVAATALRDWLADQAAAGRRVLGYGAASRAVALLCRAGVDVPGLPAVADASPAKWGRRMPGTSIPVISPRQLIDRRPDIVLLFVPDLLAEVRAAYPQIAGWAIAEPAPHLVG
jgi:hypothetical protein